MTEHGASKPEVPLDRKVIDADLPADQPLAAGLLLRERRKLGLEPALDAGGLGFAQASWYLVAIVSRRNPRPTTMK